MSVEKRRLSEEERLQQLKEKQAAMKRDIQRREKAINEKKRKERTKRLIESGGLAEIAGLLAYDAQTMMGALLDVAYTIKQDPAKASEWRKKGAEVLALTPAERKERGIGFI